MDSETGGKTLKKMRQTEKNHIRSGGATDRQTVLPFHRTLENHDIRLVRDQAATLQVNLGLRCNQTCKHCHLDAGPRRTESMDAHTVAAVVAYATRTRFRTLDITGGAPELNPHLSSLITATRPIVTEIMLRSNLSALDDTAQSHLPVLLRENRVTIVASLPALNAFQTNSQRGDGVFDQSIAALRRLNAIGYARPGSELKLNLVSNPTGAFLPTNQAEAEKQFRDILKNKFDVTFDRLFVFGNMPLGRFKQWLKKTDNHASYLQRLAKNFNPCAVAGLMCRTAVSISWEGYLYDCDFNLAAGLPMSGQKIHVSEMPGAPVAGQPVMVADHCYTCTAGAGFT